MGLLTYARSTKVMSGNTLGFRIQIVKLTGLLTEREIWLINMASVTNQEYDFPSATEEKIFLFYYKGQVNGIKIESVGISEDRNVAPYKVGWKYLSMDTEGLDDTQIQSMKKILCEALKVFGQFGISRKRNPNLEIICINFEGDE